MQTPNTFPKTPGIGTDAEVLDDEKLNLVVESWIPDIKKGYRELVELKYHGYEHYMKEALEEVPQMVQRELEFCKRVISKFSQWSNETDPVVLWDLDETIGMQYKSPENNGSYVWRLRPGFKSLAEYLKETYPNIENGILTSAHRSYMDEIAGSPELNGFFTDSEVLRIALPNEPMPQREVDALSEKVRISTGNQGIRLNEQSARKYETLCGLSKRGYNVKHIDDWDSALAMGENGLYVRDVRPLV